MLRFNRLCVFVVVWGLVAQLAVARCEEKHPHQVSARQVIQAWKDADGTRATASTAVAMAFCESSFDISCVHTNPDSGHTVDRGLWQLNSKWHSEVSDADAYDLQNSTKAAYRISKHGADWTQWAPSTITCAAHHPDDWDSDIAAVYKAALVQTDAHEPLNTCGGNCYSDDCDDTCPCGTTPAYVNITKYCALADWDQSCCACIMQKESSGNANAMNLNDDDTYDVGLLQINQGFWETCNKGLAPCNPNTNIDCGLALYNQGGRLGGWGGPWKATCGGSCNCCDK